MPSYIPPETVNAFSRTVAAGLMMLGFVAGGYYLDQWLGTKFLVIVGFVLGMTCFLTVMILQSKLSAIHKSIAHVKPLPPEDDDEEESNNASKDKSPVLRTNSGIDG